MPDSATPMADDVSGSEPVAPPSASSLDPLPLDPHGDPDPPSAFLDEVEDELKQDNEDIKPIPPRRTKKKATLVNQVTLHPQGMAPVHATLRPEWADVFFRFCAERHSVWEKRLDGRPREEWTEDETMQKMIVGNIFRELDAGSIKVKSEVIGKGDQSHLEICFRLFLWCAFYKDTTWQALCAASTGGIPTWTNWKTDLAAYESTLHRLSMVEKKKIYTGGFQIVPPTIYFGRNLPHFAASLRFVQTLMECGMPSRLLDLRYAVDASSIIQTAPTMGGFLSLCFLCYLNSAPHVSYQYRNFASCGPGARMFLQRIFGKEVINSVAMEEAGLRWLYDHQWAYWSAIGVSPPHAWTVGLRPGMRVLDFENALCWAHRYVNHYLSKGWASQADKPPLAVDIAGLATAIEGGKEWAPPAWVVEERYSSGVSKAAWAGDYDEVAAQIPAVEGEGEDEVYEVEKIVARRGNRSDRDGLFRVRWKGYTPEEDTWERESSLKQGSAEALEEWLEWEQGIWDTIQRITRDQPYTAPTSTEVKREVTTPARPVRTVRAAPRTRETHSQLSDSSGSTAPSTPLRTPRTPRAALAHSVSSSASGSNISIKTEEKRSVGKPRKVPSGSARKVERAASDEEVDEGLNEGERKRPRRAAAPALGSLVVVGVDELDELDEYY